jgi:hypothetical protein
MVEADFIRSATLSGYLKAAQEVGLDARAMLKRAALPYDCLQKPDLPSPVTSTSARGPRLREECPTSAP